MSRHALPPGAFGEGESLESAFVREMTAALQRYEGVANPTARRSLVEEMQRIGREYLRFDHPRRKAAALRPGRGRYRGGEFDGKAAAAGPDPD